MTNNLNKIEIAKEFEKQYHPLLAIWTPDEEYGSEEERYLGIYENLLVGVYGDCYGVNAEFDQDGELISEATEYEVEVAQLEDYGDGTEKFCFEIDNELSGASKFIEEHGQHGKW